MKKEYQFKDLFDADKSLSEEGIWQRTRTTVGDCEELEKLYPAK